MDVLGLEAQAHEAGGELLEAGDAGEELEGGSGGLTGPGFERNSRLRDAVGEDLDALGVVDGALAVVVLDAGEVVGCGGLLARRDSVEDVGGGDGGVLQREVDADAADGGHGEAASPMQSRPGEDHWRRRLTSTVRSLMSSQELEGGGATAEEGDDALDGLLEGFEAGGLDLGEGAFGYDVADLVVVVAIDEDDEAAVVDVARGRTRGRRVGGGGGARGRRWERRSR